MDTYLDPGPFFDETRKMRLSDTAAIAHMQAIAWVYDHEVESCTFPAYELRRILLVDKYQASADELVAAGAWEVVPDGYVILHHRAFIQARLRAQAGKRRRDRSAQRAVRTSAYQEVKAAIRRGERECVACGGRDRLQVDHIVPRSQGGGEEPDNLQVLCLPCNSSKNAADWSVWQRSRRR